MARKQKLKVYRTPIGFHDAYVAAPSQKAALEAWGADVNLFASGIAEMVDDAALTRAPLNAPGIVVRVLRGSTAEHLAALPKDRPATRGTTAQAEDEGPPRRRHAKSTEARPVRSPDNERKRETSGPERPKPAPRSAPKARSKPRPSRARLEDAEKALERSEADHKAAITKIRQQEKALQQRRHDIEKHHEDEIARLEAAIAQARETYDAALDKWRD
jgi:hypothetical protein